MTDPIKLYKGTMMATCMTVSMLTSIACSSNQDDGPAVGNEPDTGGEEKPAVFKKMSPKEQIDFSKQDLATRLGLEIDAIKVSGATPVHWRSGALGCPKPGVSYTDVLVPGIWILLRVDNKAYRYHAVPNGQPFYCPDERAEPPATTRGAD